MDIQYLKNEEINFVKWDNCINNAYNGCIYAFSWYLNIICEDWDAIIKDDYSVVMPVLYRKTGPFRYSCNSIFSPRLGVFSTEILKEEIVNAFLEKLSTLYSVFSINLNKYNKVKASLFNQKPKVVYECDLIETYENLRNKYHPDINVALEKAGKHKISVIKNVKPNDFLNLITKKHVLISYQIKKDDLINLRRIIAFVYRHGIGEIYVAYNSYNELCAACLFLKSNRKSNLIFSAITQEGIQQHAMYYLIDHYIKKHAGQTLTLNFENISVPDKEKFCKGFGAGAYFYVNVHQEKPSFPGNILFRLLKVVQE